ncbi:MAG: iron-sulfur cluster assembly scaffold protein [Proteobacteria bacterium]|nr:iron-sulfur cluster assembly scaffold protein [Pseudomonadota bacterium]
MKKSQDPAWKALILDHYKQPRGYGKPSSISFQAEEHNRTCGDHIELFLTIEATTGQGQFQFTGAGCSLCIASASLMICLLQSSDLISSRKCLESFRSIWIEGLAPDAAIEWQIFDGLRDYPVRSRCVRLPWQALDQILKAWDAATEGGQA